MEHQTAVQMQCHGPAEEGSISLAWPLLPLSHVTRSPTSAICAHPEVSHRLQTGFTQKSKLTARQDSALGPEVYNTAHIRSLDTTQDKQDVSKKQSDFYRSSLSRWNRNSSIEAAACPQHLLLTATLRRTRELVQWPGLAMAMIRPDAAWFCGLVPSRDFQTLSLCSIFSYILRIIKSILWHSPETNRTGQVKGQTLPPR